LLGTNKARYEVDVRIVNVAKKLKDSFFESYVKRDEEVSIFLCGGSSPAEEKFRRDLGARISAIKSKYRYSVFYPEDMFVELILGHQRQDLLTLENLLAKSVSAVAILLQSAGTFAELGAFSNHPLLKDRLVVVIDPKYQRSSSFINTGPVRHLQKQTKSRVVYEVMQPSRLDKLSGAVASMAREIGLATPPTVDLTNPIACYEFYLALVFVLDPVPRHALISLAKSLQPDSPDLALTAAETALNGLVNEGNALLVSGTLCVSKKGIQTLFARAKTDVRRTKLLRMLSQLRNDALNIMLRKRRRKIWGEAA
jgi:hypothetical protein